MSEKLDCIINKIYPLSKKALLILANEMSFQKLSKSDLFVKIAKENDKEYILLEGICRSFVIDSEGEEITLSFYMPSSPISPNICRINPQGKSTVFIQAITDIELVAFSAPKFLEIMRSNKELSEWGNIVMQKELMLKVEKELVTASMSAKERLGHFRSTFPNLENLVPHPYIASYLGITNVSLSRLRSIISKK